MYSIDNQKQITKDVSTDSIRYSRIPGKNEFDLRDESIYDTRGKLLHEAANPKDYDFAFAIKLKKTYPIYQCADLLNYHFHKTVNKDLFLKHIEFHVLLYSFLEKQPKKVEFITTWVKEKMLLLEAEKQKNGLKESLANNVVEHYTKKGVDLVDPDLLNLLYIAEKKAIGNTLIFPSAVRCAAFCEILYAKKYILHTKNRQIAMVTFAKQRYGINILNALASSKNQDREEHKNQRKSKLPPLKHFFSGT